MEITDVRVYPVRDEKVRAFISIVLDRCFMVNDIRIIQGKDGLFVSMPSRKRKSGDFKDVAHPLNAETRKWLEERILGVYQANLAGVVATGESTASSRESVRFEDAKGSSGSSLEEVERLQFGDSFWSLT